MRHLGASEIRGSLLILGIQVFRESLIFVNPSYSGRYVGLPLQMRGFSTLDSGTPMVVRALTLTLNPKP